MATSYKYLVSGNDQRGRYVADLVEAETGDAAVGEFESHGHTNVRLHTDDAVAPMMKHDSLSKFFTPKQLVELPTIGAVRRYFLFVWIGYRQIWFLKLLAIAALVATWFMGGSLFFVVEAAAIALLFFPFIANLYFHWFGPGARYVRLLRAIGHAQWERALRLIPKITLPLAPSELPALKAQSLAGLGRLDEALKAIDDLADHPDVHPYTYWMAQSVIYQEAHELEMALGALARALELAPTSSLLMIANAGMLIAVRRDLRRATDLLTEAKRHAIAVPTLPHLHHAEGLLALHQGRTAEAVESLSAAVRLFSRYTPWSPSILPVEARLRSRLCQALAANGDIRAAEQQFRIARPILEAHREDDLLRQCEVAMATGAAPLR